VEIRNLCSSCGDRATLKTWQGLAKCDECYEELANGRIINIERANIAGVGGGRGTLEDDSSPCGQNAIRALEDIG
jgi:hypothetical protein